MMTTAKQYLAVHLKDIREEAAQKEIIQDVFILGGYLQVI